MATTTPHIGNEEERQVGNKIDAFFLVVECGEADQSQGSLVIVVAKTPSSVASLGKLFYLVCEYLQGISDSRTVLKSFNEGIVPFEW